MLSHFGAIYSTQLKAYLIECNLPISDLPPLSEYGRWKMLDVDPWYVNDGGHLPGSLFLDSTWSRVRILYSLLDPGESDAAVAWWVNSINGLDRCWLSLKQLMYLGGFESWKEKGIGLTFSDGFTPDKSAGNFSLNAWYGASRQMPGLDEVLSIANDKFAIYSTRWQKISGGSVAIFAEWYSTGKVTINRAADAWEVRLAISDMANRYEDMPLEGTKIRDTRTGVFELDFTQTLDLESFPKRLQLDAVQ